MTTSPEAMTASPEEQMVCRIAAEVDASGITVLGSFTPLAYAAYVLARRTHARDAWLVGFNAIDMPPVSLSMTGAEAAAYRGATARWSFLDITATVHLGGRGLVECISPAQIDGSGAFNVSAIGDPDRPKVRLPGGAGAPEVVQHYERIIAYVGRHDRRTLVERVDFRTGGRHPIDVAERRRRGLLAGPVLIVTPLAVLRKDHDDAPFAIESLHGGATVEEVVANTGFELAPAGNPPATTPPTPEQLRLLRDEIDPLGTIRFDRLAARERAAVVRETLDRERDRALARIARRTPEHA